jgi:predicted aspartyl protease
MADGSTVPSDTFIIRSLELGNITITNIPAIVADPSAPLLLGQTFLRNLCISF